MCTPASVASSCREGGKEGPAMSDSTGFGCHPSIIGGVNWLQLLRVVLVSCKQRNPAVIIAYFQRGVLLIRSR